MSTQNNCTKCKSFVVPGHPCLEHSLCVIKHKSPNRPRVFVPFSCGPCTKWYTLAKKGDRKATKAIRSMIVRVRTSFANARKDGGIVAREDIFLNPAHARDFLEAAQMRKDIGDTTDVESVMGDPPTPSPSTSQGKY